MKLSLLFAVPALVLGLTMSPSAAEEVASPEPVLQYLPAPPVDYSAVIRFMRTLPPDVLIDIAFDGTGAAPRMKQIARRESGLGRHADPFAACAADNPRSSASGLFQTLSGWRGLAEQNGLSWENITGRDCLDDVILARKIWDRSGFGPWRL